MRSAIIIFVVLVCFACKKESTMIYDTSDNIYFDFTPDVKDDKSDSLIYSFAYNTEKDQDTVLIPVRVSGIRQHRERKFAIRTIDTSTTAVASLHYKPLEQWYTIPADSGTCMFPLIVLNKDTALKTKSVVIYLELVAGPELGISFTSLRTGFVKLSNRLEKPTWWDAWIGELGAYSRVKHELFIRAAGTTTLSPSPADYLNTPKTLYYIRRFRSFIQDPFKWIADYPEEGFVITQEADGNYYFYNANSADNKYLLLKNASDGKYYFNDENGNRI